MRFFKNIFTFSVFLLALQSKAQFTTHSMVFAGYQYQNSSFAELGVRFLFLKDDDIMYRVSGSGLLGVANGKFAIVPKFQGDILLNNNHDTTLQHPYYFLVAGEITPQYIAPKAGFSLFGIIDLTAGYAFQLGNATLNDKVMKGFNFNFTVNVPLVTFSESKKNK